MQMQVEQMELVLNLLWSRETVSHLEMLLLFGKELNACLPADEFWKYVYKAVFWRLLKRLVILWFFVLLSAIV